MYFIYYASFIWTTQWIAVFNGFWPLLPWVPDLSFKVLTYLYSTGFCSGPWPFLTLQCPDEQTMDLVTPPVLSCCRPHHTLWLTAQGITGVPDLPRPMHGIGQRWQKLTGELFKSASKDQGVRKIPLWSETHRVVSSKFIYLQGSNNIHSEHQCDYSPGQSREFQLYTSSNIIMGTDLRVMLLQRIRITY